MPTVAEDQAIRAAAKNDLDAWPLMPAQLKTMHSIDALQSSRPKSGNKKLLVPVRQGPEVIEYFKSTGSAW